MLWLVSFCFGLVGLVGCGGGSGAQEDGGPTEDGRQGGTLTVFAAASLTDAFEELANVYEEKNPGTEVRTTFAGSSTVLRQILQGAPADVFASADEAKLQTALAEGIVAGEPQTFVRNREVVVVPKDNPADIQKFRDLSKPGTKLVLAQDGVPAAEYAKDILDKANASYGKDFKKQVLSNLVSREGDVRAAVNRVTLGDADATFGYASDVTPDIRNRVKVIEIPQDLNVIATYPIVVLKRSKNPELAQKWVELVLSEEGQKVLKKWGFEPIG